MIDQLAIAVLGAGAIALTQSSKPSRRRWAYILSMLGPPAWIYAAWHAGQYGSSMNFDGASQS